jgi:hypothetical protein
MTCEQFISECQRLMAEDGFPTNAEDFHAFTLIAWNRYHARKDMKPAQTVKNYKLAVFNAQGSQDQWRKVLEQTPRQAVATRRRGG